MQTDTDRRIVETMQAVQITSSLLNAVIRVGLFVLLPSLSPWVTLSAGIIHVPGDSTCIQGGIRGAADGDTVLVASGTYVENINFLGKAILVTSEAGAESTIIDGSAPAYPDSGSVVYFVSGEDSNSIISGFTISMGSGTYIEYAPQYWDYYGGGILCAGGSAPVIRENVIVDNFSVYGGGVACYYSPARIVGNVIRHNEAEGFGGGLHCTGADAWVEGNLITDCTGGTAGGGIKCVLDSSTFLGNAIIANAGLLHGGGIELVGHYGLVEGNYIALNEVGPYGGGIFSIEGEPTIRHNVIERNVTEGHGGGIACFAALVEGNSISDNVAGIEGGGIWTYDGAPLIVGNKVRGNSVVTGGCGGGICVAGGCVEPTIIANNLVVENNSDHYGGGIIAGPALVVNNTISHNDAPYGGGVFCWVYPYLEFLVITNNIISSNSGGHGIYNDSTFYYCVPDLYYNDVWDNGVDYYGCLPGHGDISVDPEFAEPEWGHYSLLPSSPCLDVGDPSLLDPDGTRSNMGAFGGPEAKRVHLTFVPEADTVAGGGMLSYEAILSNNFADPLMTFGLTELLMPNGFPSPLNPLVGPMRVSLGPYQTVHKTISHYVPPAAPGGEYWYTGKVGFPPDVLEDMDAFSFHVAE